MSLSLDPEQAYLTNYIPWNAKYRHTFNTYVALILGSYLYPIPFTEFERFRYSRDDSLFTLITDPEANGDYYNYEIIKVSSNQVNKDLIINEFKQYWYGAYHPEIDVIVIHATDDPNGDIVSQPVEASSGEEGEEGDEEPDENN